MKLINNKLKFRWLIVILLAILVSSLIRKGYIQKINADFKDKEIVYQNTEYGFSITLPTAPTIETKQMGEGTAAINKLEIKSVGGDNSEYILWCYKDSSAVDSAKLLDKIHTMLRNSIDTSGYNFYSMKDTRIANIPTCIAISEKGRERRYMLYMTNNNQTIFFIGNLKHNPLQQEHFEKYFYSIKKK